MSDAPERIFAVIGYKGEDEITGEFSSQKRTLHGENIEYVLFDIHKHLSDESQLLGAADEIERLTAENVKLREALEEADHARIGLSHFADRAHAGEVDAGGRELKRQVLLKFQTFEGLYLALGEPS